MERRIYGKTEKRRLKAIAQRERLERQPMSLMYISMKMQLKQSKID